MDRRSQTAYARLTHQHEDAQPVVREGRSMDARESAGRTFLGAARRVLEDAGEPLRPRAIVGRALAAGLPFPILGAVGASRRSASRSDQLRGPSPSG